jgi:hypothetical protein
MNRLLDWLKTNPQRKAGAVLFVVVTVLACIHAVDSMKSEAIDRTRYRLFMDSETGKTFTLELKIGMTIPVISPYTGRATGYQPEACYWNADGTTKSTPTYVILNSYLGKSGPTFCPDCGRLVVANNPPPAPGQRPPPTRDEYGRRYSNAGNAGN